MPSCSHAWPCLGRDGWGLAATVGARPRRLGPGRNGWGLVAAVEVLSRDGPGCRIGWSAGHPSLAPGDAATWSLEPTVSYILVRPPADKEGRTFSALLGKESGTTDRKYCFPFIVCLLHRRGAFYHVNDNKTRLCFVPCSTLTKNWSQKASQPKPIS